MTLGTTLLWLRRERGWTQGKLSANSGVSQSHISKIEHDEYEDVSARIVAQLASALEVSTDYLCEEAGWLLERPRPEELAPAEHQLIETVRAIPTARIRQKVLEQFTWIAQVARDAGLARLQPLLGLATEGREEYEEKRR